MIQPDLIRGPMSTAEGDGDDLIKERASATPAAPVVSSPAAFIEGVPPGESGASLQTVSGPLADLQAWFYTIMTHPESVEAGFDAAQEIQAKLNASKPEAIVQPTRRMTVMNRMAIYHYAYHARLVDCLADDFETVSQALGQTAFERLSRAYIAAHPSENPSLNAYGHRFSDFIRTASGLDAAPFLADLARLEWTIVEKVHAPEGQQMDLAALGALSPEAQANIRLYPSPTLRVETFDYPVSPYFTQVMQKKTPPIPEPGWSATAIYRYEDRIWRMELTEETYLLLKALVNGVPLGEALARVNAPAHHVMEWFQEWMRRGFFENFRAPEPSIPDPS